MNRLPEPNGKGAIPPRGELPPDQRTGPERIDTKGALAMATAAHAGQVDLAGEPYIGHPRRVADRVSHLGEREVMAALLHDVLEDTDVTAEELLERGVPVDVVDTVQILTKRPGEPYEEFVARIVRSGDPIVVAIKLADIADNLDEVRLRQLPPEVARRLCHKYEAARRALTAIALDRS